jgi:hypothetical protein
MAGRAFQALALVEHGPGADESEVHRVHRTPAGLGGLDQLGGHRQPGRDVDGFERPGTTSVILSPSTTTEPSTGSPPESVNRRHQQRS